MPRRVSDLGRIEAWRAVRFDGRTARERHRGLRARGRLVCRGHLVVVLMIVSVRGAGRARRSWQWSRTSVGADC
jgi:hypothetical protein